MSGAGAHDWQTEGRVRSCARCGVRTYRIAVGPNVPHAHEWTDAAPTCQGRTARRVSIPAVRAQRAPAAHTLPARVLAALRVQPDAAPGLAARLGKSARDISTCLKQQRDLGKIVPIGEQPRADGKHGRGAIIYRVAGA